MRYNPSVYVRFVVLACALAAVRFEARGQQVPSAPSAQPIVNSAPTSPEVTRRLEEIKACFAPPQSVNDTVAKPFSFGNPVDQGFGNAPMIVPPEPVLSSRRARQLLDQRKNWMYMTEKDYSSDNTIEKALQSPEDNRDQQEERSASMLERFYMRSERAGRSAVTNRVPTTLGQIEGQTDGSDALAMPSGVNAFKDLNSKKLKAAKLGKFELPTSPFNEQPVTWGADDLFGLGKPKEDKAVNDRQNGAVDDFQKMLQIPGIPASSAAKDVADFSKPFAGVGEGLGSAGGLDNSMGMRPVGMGLSTRPQGLSDTAIGPVAVGAMPPSFISQPEKSHFLKPPATFAVPKRDF